MLEASFIPERAMVNVAFLAYFAVAVGLRKCLSGVTFNLAIAAIVSAAYAAVPADDMIRIAYDPVAVWWSQQVALVYVAYLLVDMAIDLERLSLDIVLHHTLAAVAFVLSYQSAFGAMVGMNVCMVEMTTVALHLRKVLRPPYCHSAPAWLQHSVDVFFVFFYPAVRLVWFPLRAWRMFVTETYPDNLMPSDAELVFARGALVASFALNVGWSLKILQIANAKRMGREKKTTPP